MKRHLVLSLLLTCIAAHAEAAPKRWLVAFKPGTSEAEMRQVLDQAGLAPVSDLSAIGVMAGSQKIGVMAAPIGALKGSPKIAAVEEDFYEIWTDRAGAVRLNEPVSLQGLELPSLTAVLRGLPKAPALDAQVRLRRTPGTGADKSRLAPAPFRTRTDELQNAPAPRDPEVPWGIDRVHAPEAFALGAGDGAGVRVAVIDTGIDDKHPELAGAVAGGFNATSGPKDAWRDDNGHGTHVSGTIAAARDGKGVVGVAPGVKLFAVKVLDKDGGGFLTDILQGIVWCAQNRIQVANMSLGSERGVIFMKWAVQYAHMKGVTIVAAAGNSGAGVGYPAAYEETIAVSALDRKDKLAYFSSRGKEVDFIAPGVDVESSVPGGGFATHSGTSMAAPHMTGLAALAVARGAKGPEAVRVLLRTAAAPLPGLSAEEQGAGLVDARKLVKAKGSSRR